MAGLYVRVFVASAVVWVPDVAPYANTIFKLYSHRAKRRRIISLMSLRYMKAFDVAVGVEPVEVSVA